MTTLIIKSSFVSSRGENESIEKELFIITKTEWDSIVKKAEKLHYSYHPYNTNRWVRYYNLKELVLRCEIIEDNPSKEVLTFARKIAEHTFIDFIIDEITTTDEFKLKKHKYEPSNKEIYPFSYNELLHEKSEPKVKSRSDSDSD
jgi:hypothetical protein